MTSAGITNFLKSRGIELPKGNDKDDDDAETVYGLGNRKNRLFNALMKEKGVVVYKATVEIIKVRSADVLCRLGDVTRSLAK
jgi:hypothetical protein